ncbi:MULTISPECIES: DUF2066 domain-containing protein [Shewanella]|jgi:hypothetical protein|uniref:DUF2066 domain-containing protein n=2 Tax=Shewanella chilikensis TaxID=558541 RepID=A0A6G7LS76_9GAMM|nr:MULTISPECIES: DUF2066 domain-containing protein [Shewanella]MCA0951186.1 DUF2066 domain-containing protein [Shewanella chilikensis]MCL1153024.1 DUF2066 domain-containing protein [Shewanella chilikensis]MCL1161522.1 DUF2066 domain-containing protein [Shewanella chilikensis]PYE57779.1 hypothetical protein C8J23_11994 [Shewanella chilikensis]QIJ04637.1 DUF2066 domain-containing protein [Shewanella chilikensis]
MLNSFVKPVVFLSLFCATTLVQAVEVKQLDEATVAVGSRSSAEKSKGLKKALEDVILKNSGSRSALESPEIQAKLANANALVSQFGYLDTDEGLKLKANFDHRKIVDMLRNAGLPVWGKQRPLTLFWLSTDINNERVILSDDSSAEERKAFADASMERGVPLMFPLMDLDDLMRINVNDVRGLFADTVATASARYQADFFAMGALEANGSEFNYQLVLYPKTDISQSFGQPLLNRQGQAASKDEAVAEMMLSLSDYFVSRYAIADSGDGLLSKVRFTGISQMKQLVEIEAFLNQLSAVREASLSTLQGDSATFKVQLFGSEDDLKNLLRLEPRLSAAQSGFQDVADGQGYDGFNSLPQATENTEFNENVSQPLGPYQWHSR